MNVFYKAIGLAAIALVIGFGLNGCNGSDDEKVASCRQKFCNAIRGFEESGTFEKDALSNALAAIADVKSLSQRAMLVNEFEDAFFMADISHFDIRQQLAAMDSFVSASDSLRCGLSDAMQTDGWNVRIRTISWVKCQLERIKKSEPETPESRARDANLWHVFASAWNVRSEAVFDLLFYEWLKRHPLVRRGVVKSHRTWKQVVDGRKDYILRPLVVRCVRELEDGTWPLELRRQRLKELESVVGGSIRDETFWNERFRFKGSHSNVGDVEVDVEL